jgi:hypothetical protein
VLRIQYLESLDYRSHDFGFLAGGEMVRMSMIVRTKKRNLPPYRLLAVTLFATPPRSEAPRTSLYLGDKRRP